MNQIKVIVMFTVFFTLTISTFSNAQTLVRPKPAHQPDLVTEGNLWAITGYQDAFRHAPYAAENRACYFYLGQRGSHDLYAWVSTTFHTWWGFAEKEGDQVFQFGNFAPMIERGDFSRWWEINWRGHSSSQFELVSRRRGRLAPRDMATGHINAYIEPGFARVFANMKQVRIGRCLPQIAARIESALAGADARDADGSVKITDALLDVLVNASADIPQRKRADGSIADDPFDRDLAPAEALSVE